LYGLAAIKIQGYGAPFYPLLAWRDRIESVIFDVNFH
jgi:hypothetical protein